MLCRRDRTLGDWRLTNKESQRLTGRREAFQGHAWAGTPLTLVVVLALGLPVTQSAQAQASRYYRTAVCSDFEIARGIFEIGNRPGMTWLPSPAVTALP